MVYDSAHPFFDGPILIPFFCLMLLENLRIFLDLFGDRGIPQHISTGSIDKFTHATQGVNFEGATRAIKDRATTLRRVENCS